MLVNNKDKVLEICHQFEKKVESQTVFDFIPKSQFVQTLYDLINSEGEYLYQSKNTCGIAAVMYLSAKNDIVQFTKFAISIYESGEGKLNDYRVTKVHKLKKWSRNIKPDKKFNGVSLVIVGSVRFIENTSIRFNKGTMDGMTWPKEVRDVSKKVLESVLVECPSFLLGFRIKKLNQVLLDKMDVILLYRTSSWRKGGSLFKDSWHYIVLKNIVSMENNKLELTYWDYGLVKRLQISKFHFHTSIIKTFVFSKV